MINEENEPVLIDWGTARWGAEFNKTHIACGNLECSGPQLFSTLVKSTKGYSSKHVILRGFAIGNGSLFVADSRTKKQRSQSRSLEPQ